MLLSYDFKNLGDVDFEDLVRDLIGRELKIRFEAFGPGPDGGMDGRHSRGKASTIVQAKHYAKSQVRSLLARMKKERPAIDRIKAKRYVLATSSSLSPASKAKLAAAIGPTLKAQGDIFSAEDLNGLLRKYPRVEKAHIKLWLSSTAVLERVTRAAAHTYAAITIDEIAAKVRVYAPNSSLGEARKTLEAQHVLIVSGPPGVGKTTLAEILSWAYVNEKWKLIPIRSLDDGFAAIVDAEKQVFFFDDFLGKVALDKNALANKDSDLSRFIKRVKGSRNARFILTTRAYIFEEARRISEYLADGRLDISKYILNVGVYTRRIRARILYNHLLVAGTPISHVRALINSGLVPKIIDHDNYNPRIIEWMTDAQHASAIAAKEYPNSFMNALADPSRIWDTAFRTHIPEKCRHLLFALFFSSEYGEEIADLRLAYQSLHPALCTKYGQSYDPRDFEEALKILEGSFVTISNRSVSFVNPSVRDYLTEYLRDIEQLSDFAAAARQGDWARAVWWQGKAVTKERKDQRAQLASAFKPIAQKIQQLPVWKRSGTSLSRNDLANADRIILLIDWWEASNDDVYARIATDIAVKPIEGFTSWLDGTDLITLIGNFRNEYYPDFPYTSEMLPALENGLIGMLEDGVASDELESIIDAIFAAADVLGPDITNAAKDAVRREFDEIERMAAESSSQSTLEEHKETLTKLAPRIGLDGAALALKLSALDDRIAEIEEETEEADSPSFNGSMSKEADKFDDVALMNLFAPLISHRGRR
jgi:hypothetical protein